LAFMAAIEDMGRFRRMHWSFPTCLDSIAREKAIDKRQDRNLVRRRGSYRPKNKIARRWAKCGTCPSAPCDPVVHAPGSASALSHLDDDRDGDHGRAGLGTPRVLSVHRWRPTDPRRRSRRDRRGAIEQGDTCKRWIATVGNGSSNMNIQKHLRRIAKLGIANFETVATSSVSKGTCFSALSGHQSIQTVMRGWLIAVLPAVEQKSAWRHASSEVFVAGCGKSGQPYGCWKMLARRSTRFAFLALFGHDRSAN
jgi:hypothetical protein